MDYGSLQGHQPDNWSSWTTVSYKGTNPTTGVRGQRFLTRALTLQLEFVDYGFLQGHWSSWTTVFLQGHQSDNWSSWTTVSLQGHHFRQLEFVDYGFSQGHQPDNWSSWTTVSHKGTNPTTGVRGLRFLTGPTTGVRGRRFRTRARTRQLEFVDCGFLQGHQPDNWSSWTACSLQGHQLDNWSSWTTVSYKGTNPTTEVRGLRFLTRAPTRQLEFVNYVF